jgi:hypothetical protein
MTKTVTNSEVIELMAQVGREIFDQGFWEWTTGKNLIIVDYDIKDDQQVREFLGKSMASSMLIRAFDVYDVAEAVNVGYGEVLQKIVSFITAELLSEEMNLIVGVDRQCNNDKVDFVDHLKIVAAQYKASVTVIKLDEGDGVPELNVEGLDG